MDNIQEYSTGAVRSSDANGVRYDLVSPIGLRRVAETCKEGSLKYDDWNWLKGFPMSDVLNHCMRHIELWRSGDTSEDHLAHAAWNLFALMHFEETRPDLMDIPSRMKSDTPKEELTSLPNGLKEWTKDIKAGDPIYWDEELGTYITKDGIRLYEPEEDTMSDLDNDSMEDPHYQYIPPDLDIDPMDDRKHYQPYLDPLDGIFTIKFSKPFSYDEFNQVIQREMDEFNRACQLSECCCVGTLSIEEIH